MSDSAIPASNPSSLVIKNSPDFRVVYSNIFQYRLTISDASVVFGVLSDSGEPRISFQQTQEVAVIMNYGQLKNLAEYLALIVSRYEREIGPILGVGVMPPSDSELDGLFSTLKAIGVHR